MIDDLRRAEYVAVVEGSNHFVNSPPTTLTPHATNRSISGTKMIRFGKSFGPLLEIKSNLFSQNDEFLMEQEQVTNLYRAQPIRSSCKICNRILNSPHFSIHGVGYCWCHNCGHLNGCYQDTEEFVDFLYSRNGGHSYASAYLAADRSIYDQRVRDIYRPKAEFLREALLAEGASPETLSYIDIGAGSGYFIRALELVGAGRAIGWEPSAAQVEFANVMIGPGRVIQVDLADPSSRLRGIHAEVVSMIGVLEHLTRPRDVLASLQANASVKWIFLSLPLAGPTVAIEALFPTVMRRLLVGGHTHLFTNSSIDFMCAEFGWRRASEWWFGTDMFDLFRSGWVRLSQHSETSKLVELWRKHLLPALDEMQLALDKGQLSTEVHLLLMRA